VHNPLWIELPIGFHVLWLKNTITVVFGLKRALGQFLHLKTVLSLFSRTFFKPLECISYFFTITIKNRTVHNPLWIEFPNGFHFLWPKKPYSSVFWLEKGFGPVLARKNVLSLFSRTFFKSSECISYFFTITIKNRTVHNPL